MRDKWEKKTLKKIKENDQPVQLRLNQNIRDGRAGQTVYAHDTDRGASTDIYVGWAGYKKYINISMVDPIDLSHPASKLGKNGAQEILDLEPGDKVILTKRDTGGKITQTIATKIKHKHEGGISFEDTSFAFNNQYGYNYWWDVHPTKDEEVWETYHEAGKILEDLTLYDIADNIEAYRKLQ